MAGQPLVLDAHGKHAQAVHFTRDGKHLVSAGQDARIRVWSVPGFKPQRVLEGHQKSVNSLSFTADEQILVTGASDPAVRSWSFRDGKCRFTLEKQNLAAIGPDGDHLVTVSTSGELVLWDGHTGEKRRTYREEARRIHAALAAAHDVLGARLAERIERYEQFVGS